jgi:dihydrodipicolinate synthase/N-acetylneuraminate lyase
MDTLLDPPLRAALQRGLVIPACPLALNAARRLDERRQRALVRYYAAAGAGGLAVGVHTTQFAIRDPEHSLLDPVLRLAAEELARADRGRPASMLRIAGACGPTAQAVSEATLARECGYHATLLSLSALKHAPVDDLVAHCRSVSEALPVIGFYLQPAVGGRVLPYRFWRRLCEIDSVIAIKIAPFNRYQTLDVVRAVADSGRGDIALYTGNDDNIIMDLLTPFHIGAKGSSAELRIVGGLLGQWAVWTRAAVGMLESCHTAAAAGGSVSPELLRLHVALTDANGAIFDAANGFHGCIAGIHEILRRQGLLEGLWCLDPHESLGPGQLEEIDRVCRAYPHLADDAFVRENLDRWLSS